MRIYSIFNSIDGEVNPYGQGSFTTFIRFAGCNLKCHWCDTEYAQDPESGKSLLTDEIVTRVEEFGCKRVTITGGEPLLQPEGFQWLTKDLWHKGYQITVETNGSLPLEGYGISSWIVDFKLPSSGELGSMNHEVFASLRANDYVKMVIADSEDYRVAKNTLFTLKLAHSKAKVVFSPCMGSGGEAELINWMREDRLFSVQINFQLHKLLNLEEPK